MLRQLTLAALFAATAAVPLVHAQENDDSDTYRTERMDRGDDGDRASDRDRDRTDESDRAGMRDMRHGDRWARPMAEERDDRGPPPRWMKDRGPRPRGPMGPGPHRGPPPPPEPMAGFDIDLGPGRSIRVHCGDEPIRACVDAVQPVVERALAMNGDMAKPGAMDNTPVPPPPSDLVKPPADAGTANDAAPPPPPPARPAR